MAYREDDRWREERGRSYRGPDEHDEWRGRAFDERPRHEGGGAGGFAAGGGDDHGYRQGGYGGRGDIEDEAGEGQYGGRRGGWAYGARRYGPRRFREEPYGVARASVDWMYGEPYGGPYRERQRGAPYGGYGADELDWYGEEALRAQERAWDWGGGRAGIGWGRSHAGRGPRAYRRPDVRIEEEVNEALTWHPEIDASEIEVRVEQGEVTLTGEVNEKREKRLIEDLVDDVYGVIDVHNRIRVKRRIVDRLIDMTERHARERVRDRDVTRGPERDRDESSADGPFDA